MTAVEITKPGGPEVLIAARRPVPTIKDGEILVRVLAAGVNRPDAMQRAGSYPPPAGVTDIPGLDVAGEVVAVRGAGPWQVGDRVCALVAGGGYAEYCAVPAPQALPVPKGLSAIEAASLPETVFTVWTNVYDRAHLKAGESLLVHGGASGIGVAAIQMAKATGATVYATAGSADKCRACESLGAAKAINYRDADFVTVIKELTQGRGVDVVLDMVAGDYIAKNLEVLAMDGRLSIIAFLRGHKAEVSFARVLMKRLSITGSALRPQSVAAKGAIAASLRRTIWPLIESGRIRAVIDTVYPLAEAAKAHARLESNAHVGKVMLEVAKE
ncbi:MAG: NAD(P)H-quinone oxidoreductase [Alphaproteobacteria bacterium]|nr:NAD(P)H-quinone oxidoreductase [Alphaproteobacteria bacterium]